MMFQVVLCANSKPALNDVTAEELIMVMKQVALVCPIIHEHLEAGTLCVRESGQASPCLDLRLGAVVGKWYYIYCEQEAEPDCFFFIDEFIKPIILIYVGLI